MVFIDGANLFFALLDNGCSGGINYLKFANKLCEGRRLARTYYYDAPIPEAMDAERAVKQQRYFTRLNYIDYLEKRLGRMVRKTTRCRKCNENSQGWVQKGVDVKLAVDLVDMAAKNLYEVGIVVSGDGDLEPAVYSAKSYGQHIELAYFPGRSQKLQGACDRFVGLSKEYLADCY